MQNVRAKVLSEFAARLAANKADGLVAVSATCVNGKDQSTLALVSAMNNALRLASLGKATRSRLR